MADAEARDVAVPGDHPVQVRVVDDDLTRGRWTVFFRLLLALPHLIVLSVFALIAILLLPILWIVTLIRAAPPHGLGGLYGRLLLYRPPVQAYVNFATQRFPPFLGAGEPYAIELDLPLP